MSLPAALRRRVEYVGPAIFSYGFRPFFLGAAVWAALAMVLWLPQYFGHLALPTAFPPLDWHIHEMVYGYVAAAVAGFLLTAIPNWTGRLPVNGYPLAALFALWLLGRIAIAGSAIWGVLLAAVVDVSFLLVFAAVACGEIVAGRNWRNLRVLIVLAVLIAGNVVFHAEVIRNSSADYGTRIGISALIGLIMLVGGRIVPSFTRNWLTRNNPGRLPQPFSRFDGATIGVSALALACWIALPQSIASGILLVIAGLLQTVRHVRWAGDRTLADRLVLVLHVAYAFVPIGFLLMGVAVFWPAVFSTSAGFHAWTAGAVGLMTLAVMTRASLGHTGQGLVASLPTQFIYLFAFIAALARIIAAFEPSRALLHIAAAAWVLAFGGFVVFFGPLLMGYPPVWSSRRTTAV
ncbi:MAG TPA: NnrS family protein [Xanthobacteraceae bacterium]|nr:NnrS family protein [Xanthobacteraceae bacterium]